MNKVIAVAAVLALTSAESRFYPKQRPIPNLVAYDNEMVYYKNPKDYPNRPHGFFTDSVRDDELFLDTATDNEMVWYPNGYGPKPIRTSDGSYMVTRSVQHQDDELMMRIDPSEPRPHRHIFSPLVNSAQDDELFVEDANDDELVYYFNPKDYPKTSNPFVMTQALHDDELFVEAATDNEMVWYPNGYGPKPIPTSDGSFMVTRSVQHQDDELMMRIDPSEPRPHRRIFSPLVNSAQDDELVYYFNPKDYPKISNPFVITNALHDDELFVEAANDNEMVWYPPSEAYKYQRNPFGPITQVHDDEQMIRLDPREWQGFNTKTYDDDEQMIRLDPREWQGFNPKTYDDDELFNAEQVEGKVKKFKDTLSKHTETIKQAQKDVKNLGGILKKLAQDQKNGVQNDNFPLLGQLIKEGRHLAHEVKAQRTQKKPEVHDNNLFIEDVQDNDLSLKDKIKGAVNWVGDHPQVISEGAKAYKTLRGGK